MAFTCGNCKGHHNYAAEGRACYKGDLFSCYWLVQRYTEDGPIEVDCGAPAIATEHGWTCSNGHSHVDAETRSQEGWDYAHDPIEAYQLMQASTFPMTMDGSGPSEIHRP